MRLFRRKASRPRYSIRAAEGPTLLDIIEPSVSSDPDQSLSLSAVYASVDRLSSTISTLPVHLILDSPSGKQRATGHPLWRLLRIAPNEFQSPADFFAFIVVCLLLRGNAYIHIRRNKRGEVDRLLPIHPDRITVRTSPDGSRPLYYLDRQGVPFQYGEIWHVKGLSTDGVTGVSAIRYAATTIDAGISAEKIGKAILENTAKPAGLLTTDSRINDEEAQALRAAWDAAYSGAGQGKVAILPPEVKFTPISITLEDKQYIESRQLTREDVAGIFGLPLYLLTGKAPSGSAEELASQFYTLSLRPWLVRIEQSFRKDVLLDTEQGLYDLRFSVDGLMRASLTARTAAYKTQLEAGILTVNEARELEERPPLRGRDIVYAPLSMAHVDAETGEIIYNGPQIPIDTQEISIATED